LLQTESPITHFFAGEPHAVMVVMLGKTLRRASLDMMKAYKVLTTLL